jgi:hypothetical protein
MNQRVILLSALTLLTGCSASHEGTRALATPQSAALGTAPAVVTPQSGASEAARAAPTALESPQGGASEAARAAGAEPRGVKIPKTRGVPASGVASEVGSLPLGVPYASETDPVRIVSFAISSTIIHPGDNVSGDVVTTSNAASVTAEVGSIRVEVPKVAPGKFHLLLQLPSMPLPPGDAKVIITAIRADGKRTTREVPITVVL